MPHISTTFTAPQYLTTSGLSFVLRVPQPPHDAMSCAAANVSGHGSDVVAQKSATDRGHDAGVGASVQPARTMVRSQPVRSMVERVAMRVRSATARIASVARADR